MGGPGSSGQSPSCDGREPPEGWVCEVCDLGVQRPSQRGAWSSTLSPRWHRVHRLPAGPWTVGGISLSAGEDGPPTRRAE